MAEDSAIKWTDSTFNPWVGCQRVSEGCRGGALSEHARTVNDGTSPGARAERGGWTFVDRNMCAAIAICLSCSKPRRPEVS